MLTPCAHCRRHVQSREPRCPFCDGKVGTPRGTTLAGRVSRAVVFGSAALTAAACDQGTRPEPSAKHETAPATGTIRGKATWSGSNAFGYHSGTVAEGTELVLISVEGKVVQWAKTNAGGEYEFANVPVGTYLVELHTQFGGSMDRPEDVQIQVHENAIEQANLDQAVALPYGSPPARRRVV